jgi:hypothetical protein
MYSSTLNRTVRIQYRILSHSAWRLIQSRRSLTHSVLPSSLEVSVRRTLRPKLLVKATECPNGAGLDKPVSKLKVGSSGDLVEKLAERVARAAWHGMVLLALPIVYSTTPRPIFTRFLDVHLFGYVPKVFRLRIPRGSQLYYLSSMFSGVTSDFLVSNGILSSSSIDAVCCPGPYAHDG